MLEPARRRHVLSAFAAVVATTLLLTGWSGTARGSVKAGSSAAQVGAATTPRTRPNVVVVMADDMRADDLRFMPAVRSLVAARGLTFRNSFSPYPLCCPARASFLTGRYAHNHHVFSHSAPWGFQSFDDRRTLATALRRGGYQTGFVGKYLNGYGEQPSLVTGKGSFHYVPDGWTDWYALVGRPRNSRYTSGGTYDYFHPLFNVNGRIDDGYRGSYQTTVVGSFARRLVRTYHRSPRPFFLFLSSVAPHFGGPVETDDPVDVPSTNGGRIDIVTPARPAWVRGRFDAEVTQAPGLPVDGGPSEADNRDKPRAMRWQQEPGEAERVAVRDSTRQRAEALYVLDRQVAKLVATLRSTGEYRSTVFVFTSDNGYFLGEHRMRQGKVKPHEPSLRVPLVMAGPGIPHGERFDPVTTPGLTATVAELAGVTRRMPYAADGVSMVPSLRGDRGWDVPVVVEAHDASKVFPRDRALRAAGFEDPRNTIGIRTAQYKYVRYSTGEGELYDLDVDPAELTNQFADPDHAAVREQLEQVWLGFKDCRGAACRQALPASLRRAPALLRTRTVAQAAAVRARYGVRP